ADALKTLGIPSAAPSKDLVIEAPQIAENGAVVPIEITSNLPGTTSLTVLVEKNPFPLAGKFEFKEGAVPFVKLNVKMGETSDVRVIAEAGGKHYAATKEIKVTIGGCGG
ncbi:MAG: thiosulfate oxidation carrier protein SoxY, partial [Pseudomonadota bacterium]|nr:thiosulfate oxidation carrier protein SoxY [Pseudomonadota bacterium]